MMRARLVEDRIGHSPAGHERRLPAGTVVDITGIDPAGRMAAEYHGTRLSVSQDQATPIDEEVSPMKLSDLIQAVEEGRTLRQVLEAAHGKPAEEIGTEGQDLAEYQHDLDSPITAIYTAASDIALVAGETVWQDCDTMSVVSSADILADEVFRRTWSQVYPDTRVRIAIVEAGADYSLRIADIEAELTGDTTQELVEQAKAAVAARGYRVMPDEEGGCCEYCQEIDAYGNVQESIAITVYPEPARE